MLSIIIPAKNEEAILPVLFESLARQSYRDFEVIVADAGSTDRTREIAESSGARIVSGGLPGVGRNRGAEVARGDLYLFLDADTVLPDPQFLASAVTEIRARGLDVSAPFLVPISSHWYDRVYYHLYNAYARLTERVRPHAPGFCMFATRRAHELIRGFDEDVVFAEDHEYAQRAFRAKCRFGVLVKPSPVLSSIRRFERDGRLRIVIVYLWTELRMAIIGPYKRKTPFTYEMGGPEKKEKE